MFTRSLFIGCALGLVAGLALAQPPITALAVCPDGQQVVVGSQAGLSVFKFDEQRQPRLVRSLMTSLSHVHDLCFSKDGQLLLAAGGSPAETGEVEIYRWPECTHQQKLELSKDVIYRIWLSAKADWLASAGHDGKCRLTNISDETHFEYTSHSRPVLALTTLPHREDSLIDLTHARFLSAGLDQTIQLWTAKGERERTFNNHTATITDLATQLAKDGQAMELVSVSEDRTVRLWQPEIGRMVRFLRLETTPRRVVWLPERHLVVLGDDGSIYRINPDDMQILEVVATKIQVAYELVVYDQGVLVGGTGGIESVALKSSRP